MNILLELKDINTYYDLSNILFGVWLRVVESEVVFLLGRNGVGKSTTMKSIMGMPAPRAGRIRFEGQEIARLPTFRISRKGIGFVPEGRRILAGLTVEENLKVASLAISQRKKTWTTERIFNLFPILQKRRNQEAVTLSGGEQQMLAISRGLMGNPRLLLIDEPVEGLAPLIAHAVGETLIELKKEGVTMLLVDDDAKLAGKIADRVYFMDQGKTLWEGDIQKVLENDHELAKKYLGVA